MVDTMNPTNQFHPYQRETSVPVEKQLAEAKAAFKDLAVLNKEIGIGLSGLAAITLLPAILVMGRRNNES